MKRKRDEAFGFLIHLSVDLPLSFPPPCFPFALSRCARHLARLAELQSERGSSEERDNEAMRRGSERAKWLVGFRLWIGIDSPGRGCLHSADGCNKGQTTLLREGHETSADIILRLPPVPDDWGSNASFLYHAFSNTCL